MRPLHIVWDWNGTLFDDLEIIVESLNVGMARFGIAPIDADGYRDHFTRPVRAFYEALFERRVSDMEWADLNKTFHDEYYARVHRASLTTDAVEAIDRVSGLGWSQSLLSMSTHDRLHEVVASHGLTDHFSLIEGLLVPTGGLKSQHLETHLGALGHEPADVMLVGDTPDDAVAAREVGAGVILYDGGSHHLPALRSIGVPVAHSLRQAVDMATHVAEASRSGPM